MSSLQAQARALGDPTRHRVFLDVVGAGRPVGVGELAARFGLHHNAIRQHLAKLVAAELVVETTAAPAGPGRPRLQYEPSPAADSRWGAVGPYERLSRMLAEVIRSGRTPRDVGRDEGRRRPVPGPGTDALSRLQAVMARDGFEPEARPAGPDLDVVLQRCPFASTAATDPATVCSLHLGMAEGLVEQLPGLEVVDLVPRDPHGGDCVLRVRAVEPDRYR